MRLKSIRLLKFKRFTDFTITDIPATARLLVLAGPNGSGKSSIFDGLKTWHWFNGAPSSGWDESYGAKVGAEPIGWTDRVAIEFHEPLPPGAEDRKRLIYVRSAFRNEADFNIPGVNRLPSPLDSPRVMRLIDPDVSVSDNYQRLILQTLDGVYSDDLPEAMTRLQLRDRIIGKVRSAMAQVFPDLQLDGVGGVMSSTDTAGTFYFTKGSAKRFLYKNLSAGEKAVFDLLLDGVVKAEYFDNSLWCIDEPETHLNTRIQGILLQALVDLLPKNSQMLLASHSIGFMRKAWEMARSQPGSVAFIDLQNVDFDEPAIVLPIQPSRDFWNRTLDVALGDLASLMAPEHIVLCEGRPAKGNTDKKGDFDASCYRKIFAAEFPDTDFLSVGSSLDVRSERLEAGRAIQTIASGTELVKVIDRDLMSDEEVEEAEVQGYRVLSRRHIEAYLLDDEVLAALCNANGQQDRVEECKLVVAEKLNESVKRGNDPDDYKSVAGEVYVEVRKRLSLTSAGSTWHAFARGTLASLMTSDLAVYQQLREDIFGSAINN